MPERIIHEGHTHVHEAECGHTTSEHARHTDYLHNGHLHHPHGEHCDNHGNVAVNTSN